MNTLTSIDPFYILIGFLYLVALHRYLHDPKMFLLTIGLAFVSFVQSTFGA